MANRRPKGAQTGPLEALLSPERLKRSPKEPKEALRRPKEVQIDPLEALKRLKQAL